MIGIEGKHPCNYATNTQDYSKNFKDEPSFIIIVTDFSKKEFSWRSKKISKAARRLKEYLEELNRKQNGCNEKQTAISRASEERSPAEIKIIHHGYRAPSLKKKTNTFQWIYK